MKGKFATTIAASVTRQRRVAKEDVGNFVIPRISVPRARNFTYKLAAIVLRLPHRRSSSKSSAVEQKVPKGFSDSIEKADYIYLGIETCGDGQPAV